MVSFVTSGIASTSFVRGVGELPVSGARGGGALPARARWQRGASRAAPRAHAELVLQPCHAPGGGGAVPSLTGESGSNMMLMMLVNMYPHVMLMKRNQRGLELKSLLSSIMCSRQVRRGRAALRAGARGHGRHLRAGPRGDAHEPQQRRALPRGAPRVGPRGGRVRRRRGERAHAIRGGRRRRSTGFQRVPMRLCSSVPI